MKTSNVVMGVMAGAAVGALMGVLYAPDSGANTRRKISRKGQDFAGDIRDKVTNLKTKATDAVDHLTSTLYAAKDELKGKVENNRMKTSPVER